MSLLSLTRISFLACAVLLAVGVGSVALSVERPLSQQQWSTWQTTGKAPRDAAFTGMNNPASRSWDYQTYLTAKSDNNRAKGQCGFGSVDGNVCALNGYAAPINWLAMVFLAIGLVGFARSRMTDGSDGVYAS